MTNMPEAKLAREAELCYATLALVTDYDVWHESHETVTVEAVIQNLLRNVATAKDVLRRVIPAIAGPRDVRLRRAAAQRGDHPAGGVPARHAPPARPAARQVLPARRRKRKKRRG